MVYIRGMERHHLAGDDGDGLAIMSGFGLRARIDNFTAGNMPGRKGSIRASRSLIRRRAAPIASSRS
jgi:hypothetical protein